MAHRFPRTGRHTRYGAQHQAARRAAVARHHPSDLCQRCGHELGPMGPNLHLDHDEDGSYLGFSHAACNRRAGAVKGQKLAAMRRTPWRSRAW